MKKILFTLIFCVAFIATKSSMVKNKVTITYHGFSVAINTPDYSYLIFSMRNETNDTVYLTRKNIEIEIIKDKTILVELKSKSNSSVLCALTFPPYFGSDKEYEGNCTEETVYREKMDIIKNKYANKLYDRNFNTDKNNKIDRESFIAAIASECIVLLPKQTINYNTFFKNKNFDKSCLVRAQYIDNGIFMTYDDNNKVGYIRY
jgi:hypothetical protein